MLIDDDNIWRTYALDGTDALREIEESLLSLEEGGHDVDQINRLYRGLHRLKGNSALLGLLRVESLAHAAEDLVGLVRDAGITLDRSLTDLMLAMTDRLAVVVESAGTDRRDVDEQAVADLLRRAHDWEMLHAPDRQREESLGRGQIVIWSNLPGPAAQLDPMPDDDDVTLELFLGLAAECMPGLLALADGSSDNTEPGALRRGLEELRLTAHKNGFGAVSSALTRAEASCETDAPGTPPLRAAVVDAIGALAQLEREYRAKCKTPQDFGLPKLHELATAAQRPGDRAVISSTRPEPVPARPAPAAGKAPAEAAVAKRDAAAPARSEGAAEGSSKPEFLRIDARKISLIMDLAGEIGLAAGAVTHHPDLAGQELEGFTAAAHKLEVLIRELQNEVSAMRLTPVAGVFQKMKRVVRDAANRTQKKVELVLEGEDTEIDKVMVDCLHDPLVHVLRNAIDHGIEPPQERLALGKPETGRIVLAAAHQGGEVSVRVTDDGRGLNRAKILERARQRGLISGDAQLSDQQVTELVFRPGFSTKEAIDELSGRGVGMDVVRSGIEALRGRVSMSSTPGQGSCLDMTVPLTLAFVEAMVVRERGRLFALPIEKVSEVFKVESSQESVNSAEGESVLRVREMMIPVMWLHRYYGEPENDQGTRLAGRVVVVVQTSRGYLALPVDELIGNQPVMLKPLKGLLARVRAAAGCGMLRSGDVALALDCERLLG